MPALSITGSKLKLASFSLRANVDKIADTSSRLITNIVELSKNGCFNGGVYDILDLNYG